MDEQVNIPALSSSNPIADAFWIFGRSMVWTLLFPPRRDWQKVKLRWNQFELKKCLEKAVGLVIR